MFGEISGKMIGQINTVERGYTSLVLTGNVPSFYPASANIPIVPTSNYPMQICSPLTGSSGTIGLQCYVNNSSLMGSIGFTNSTVGKGFFVTNQSSNYIIQQATGGSNDLSLKSANNTLDDGSGNMIINGNTSTPLIVASSAGSTSISLQNPSGTGKGMVGWTSVGIGFQNGNGDHILKQSTSSTTDKSILTFNNTLDDGSGNVTISGNTNTPLVVASSAAGTAISLQNPSGTGKGTVGWTNVGVGFQNGNGDHILKQASSSTTDKSMLTFNNILDDGGSAGNLTAGTATGGIFSKGFIVCAYNAGFYWNDGTAAGGANYFHVTSSTSGGLTFSDNVGSFNPLTIAATTGTITALCSGVTSVIVNNTNAAADSYIRFETSGTKQLDLGWVNGTGFTALNPSGNAILKQSSSGSNDVSLLTDNNTLDDGSGHMICSKAFPWGNTTVTTPSTGSQTITAAQLLGGLVISPAQSSAYTWTTDTGTAIFSAMGSPATGTTFTVLFSNDNNSAGAVMTIAFGSGVSGNLRGNTLNNNQSMVIYFRCTGTNTFTCYS